MFITTNLTKGKGKIVRYSGDLSCLVFDFAKFTADSMTKRLVDVIVVSRLPHKES